METLCDVPSSLEGSGTLWKSEEKTQKGEDAWLICQLKNKKGVMFAPFLLGECVSVWFTSTSFSWLPSS